MTSTQTSYSMPETDVLRAKIENLLHEKNEFIGRSRRLISQDVRDVRIALLVTIRETHLPCTLIFRNQSESVLAFEVSAGRILRLSNLTSDGLTNKFGGIIGESLTNTDNYKVVLRKIVDTFANLTSDLTVEAAPKAGKNIATELGIDFGELLKRTEAQPLPPSKETFVRFLKACQSFATSALLTCDDQTVFQFGEEYENETMLELAISERAAESDPRRAVGDVSSVIFSGHPTEGSALLCQACGSYLSLLHFRCDTLHMVLTEWEQAF